ncbi:histidine phosphatase family protein [Nocardioides convexus]|uniref:SixA phosphatase family protein n=1 Tax=Nocardioides convexus TaxID=2712224 RepID=UPI00241828B3|nr:histidine phosphatase family protein [Nocardioides convexus]
MDSRRLVVIRHAKAEPYAATDVERVLAERGRTEGRLLGQWLAGEGIVPEAAYVSYAARTRETWDVVAGGAGWSLQPEYDAQALRHRRGRRAGPAPHGARGRPDDRRGRAQPDDGGRGAGSSTTATARPRGRSRWAPSRPAPRRSSRSTGRGRTWRRWAAD